MATTLSDLSYAVANALGQTTQGTATGGAALTIIDTVERTEADDYWNLGTAWLLYDAGGAGAAPQGGRSLISDFANSTSTITLRSSLGGTPAAGDIYAVSKKRYPMSLLDQKINEALRLAGAIEKTDTSTITTADNTTVHSLPAGVLELREVWLQTNKVTDNELWQKVYDWDVLKSATGTADKLVFTGQPSSGYKVGLKYLGLHSSLLVYSDKLDDTIHPDLVIYRAAIGCLEYRSLKAGEGDDTMDDIMDRLQRKADKAMIMHSIHLPRKTVKTINWSFSTPEDVFPEIP